jgi:hypothetical protein
VTAARVTDLRTAGILDRPGWEGIIADGLTDEERNALEEQRNARELDRVLTLAEAAAGIGEYYVPPENRVRDLARAMLLPRRSDSARAGDIEECPYCGARVAMSRRCDHCGAYPADRLVMRPTRKEPAPAAPIPKRCDDLWDDLFARDVQ